MKKIQLKIRTHSPVHIGSGKELFPYEYVLDDSANSVVKDYHVVDYLSLVEKDEAFAARLSRRNYGPRDTSRLKNMGVLFYSGRIGPYTYDTLQDDLKRGNKGAVFDFIKDQHYRSYLPGSSIKGALRTAIAYHILKSRAEKLDDVIDKFLNVPHSQAVEEIVFRDKKRDVHADILRYLQVSDSEPFKANDTLTLALCQRLTRRKLFLHNYYEVLRRKLETKLTLSLDDKLLESPVFAKNPLNSYMPRDFKSLAKYVNDFSQDIVDFEIEFLQDCQRNHSGEVSKKIDALLDYYLDLKDQISNELKNPDATGMFIAIGKGTGWHKKTVGLAIKNRSWERFKRVFYKGRLGRKNQKPDRFPSSRDVLVEETQMFAFGWIKIEQI